MEHDTKILFLSEGYYFAGTEVYSLSLVEELARQSGIAVICGLFHHGQLAEKLQSAGIKPIYFDSLNNFKSFKQLVHLLRNENIHILHLADRRSTLIGGFAGLFCRKTKIVSTVHGLPEFPKSKLKSIKYFLSACLFVLVLRFCIDAVICVSKDMESWWKRYMPPAKLFMVHNGVQLDIINRSVPLSKANKEQKVVGTVGRLDTVKGLTFYLEAARRVIDASDQNLLFYLVGQGPLEDDLKAMAKRLGIEDKVCFLGHKKDVIAVMAGLDVFVLSSVHEGLPYVLLEAMALSRPIVCTNVGGIKEIIDHNVEGLLVAPKQPDELARAIGYLLNNSEFATELGRRARAKVEKHFSAHVMGQKTNAVYAHVMSQSFGRQSVHKKHSSALT
jgi:L-malate glycosyltransferase